MKHLILAASLVLIAVPAFAGGSKQNVNLPKSNTMTFTDTQVGGYARSYDASSARAQRDANLRRTSQGRSQNSRAAWQGLPHYY
ncbi:MAG TPA: hypothetical protein VK515_11085 [Rhizomicrobium sp.]|nr:hypothetical protein [Rhizomicrobium sp.]